MLVPRNSALSRSNRMHPPLDMSWGSFPSEMRVGGISELLEVKVGDIHSPFQGREGLAKVESLGTTKDLERPKSTILKERLVVVVPVRTTFYCSEIRVDMSDM